MSVIQRSTTFSEKRIEVRDASVAQSRFIKLMAENGDNIGILSAELHVSSAPLKNLYEGTVGYKYTQTLLESLAARYRTTVDFILGTEDNALSKYTTTPTVARPNVDVVNAESPIDVTDPKFEKIKLEEITNAENVILSCITAYGTTTNFQYNLFHKKFKALVLDAFENLSETKCSDMDKEIFSIILECNGFMPLENITQERSYMLVDMFDRYTNLK